jgi:Arc/MetJ-type ribon-helix-helix transcriptional regulator
MRNIKMRQKGERLRMVNFKADAELVNWIQDYANAHNTFTSEVIRYALKKLRAEEDGKFDTNSQTEQLRKEQIGSLDSLN